MCIPGSRSHLRNLCPLIMAIGVTMAFAPSARAAFHLWNITEIYSNASGTLQFIEMHDANDFENFVNGQTIEVNNLANTLTNTFVIPGSALPGNTSNRSLLFGTAGIQAAGGPAPDYIIPAGFLFTQGGQIGFFGANGGSYTALPTDGALSRTWQGGDALNTPTNYAGQTGFVNGVPEPSTLLLSSIAALACGAYRRRRRKSSGAAEAT